jgi:hypothetical protein
MKHQFKVILAILILALAALACGLPSLPKLPSVPKLPNTSGAAFEDNFDGFDQTWGTGTDESSSVEYADGGLKFKVHNAKYYVWGGPNDTKFSNVHIEVTAKNNSSDPNAAFGILCHQGVVNDNYYYFAITPSGQYAIAKAALTKDDLFLTNDDQWASSDDIKPGADSYRLGADCGDGTLTFYVDGKAIASVEDTTYNKGQVGLFAWSADQEDGVNVTYDDFVVTNLK